MPLAGLDENEVARMIEQRAERSPSAAFASELHCVTGGNPLFVDGVIRVLIAERKLGMAEQLDLSGFKLPEGVRGAIHKRLALLSAEARSALAVAAAIGQEFDVVLLERVNQESAGMLAELMREAAEVGIVAAPSRETYRFTHPLIREALYRDSTDAERARLHLVIAEALEETHAANLTPHLPALAHHFREAGVADKAIDYALRAGESTYTVLAFEDATFHWEAALALMEAHGSDAEGRANLLERLGDPMLLGLEAKGLQYLEEALRLREGLSQIREAAKVRMRLGNSLIAMKDQVLRDIPRAAFHFRKAQAALAKEPEGVLLGRLYLGLAWVADELLERQEHSEASRRAMEIGAHLGNELLWIHGARCHADSLLNAGQLAKGFALLGQARQKVAARSGGGYRGGMNVEALHEVIRDIPKPVIAAVNGYAIGGGHVLHIICDLSIAADTARFGQVGPRVGSVDPGFGTAYLTRLVGEKKAREIWYLCRQYSAQEALEMGLVNKVVLAAQLMDEARAWRREIPALSPTAIRIAKASFNAETDHIKGIGAMGGISLGLYYRTEESMEGRNAFMERRTPDFRKYQK